jgi:Arc/MetJ-type ribon-helix-helix transcriptional regulator
MRFALKEAPMAEPTIRTTVTLPASLLTAADGLVRSGRGRSRSDLLARALAREVERLERERLDAEFAAMADDDDFQREAVSIAAEFSAADWEALSSGEDGHEAG